MRHYLPGKEYCYSTLKPLAHDAIKGNITALLMELGNLNDNPWRSELHDSLKKTYLDCDVSMPVCIQALHVKCLAERVLLYLFVEQNLVSQAQFYLLSRSFLWIQNTCRRF